MPEYARARCKKTERLQKSTLILRMPQPDRCAGPLPTELPLASLRPGQDEHLDLEYFLLRSFFEVVFWSFRRQLGYPVMIGGDSVIAVVVSFMNRQGVSRKDAVNCPEK